MLPVTVNVWLGPATVTGLTLPTGVLLELTSVNDSELPLQAVGIEPSAIEVTTSSTTVHEIVIPLSDPHELTLALALTSLLEVELTFPATALPGTASTAAVTTASAGLKRMTYPVIVTATPVTRAALTVGEKAGVVAPPVPSSVPVCSPSEVLPAPDSVTL